MIKIGLEPSSIYECRKKFCTFRVTNDVPGVDPTRHKCPYLGGETVIRSYMSLLSQLWDELDEVTLRIIESKDSLQPEELTHLKGQAVGLAKAIVIFHRPFFDEGVKAVSQEALRRYKAKKAGESYETVGLGSRKFEAPKADIPRRTPEVDPVVVEVQNIPHNHQKVIRESTKAPEIMAQLFGCSEAAIRRIREAK